MTGPRLRRLDIRGLTTIHGELLARYGGNSRDVDLAKLELSIVRSELVVRGPHWKSRARLAAGYGWRLLVNRAFADCAQDDKPRSNPSPARDDKSKGDA